MWEKNFFATPLDGLWENDEKLGFPIYMGAKVDEDVTDKGNAYRKKAKVGLEILKAKLGPIREKRLSEKTLRWD
jgi:hypothetical protein